MKALWRFVPLVLLAIYVVVVGTISRRFRRSYGYSPIRLSGSGGSAKGFKAASLVVLAFVLVWQALAAALGLYIPLGNQLFDPLPAVGLLVLLAGAALVIWAITTMGASWEIPINSAREAPPAGLITSGPFRCSRHPIYLGLPVMLAGWMLLIPTVPSIVIGIVAALGVRRQAIEEEGHLLRTYGSEYQAWARDAGCLIPWLGRLR
jgi:protein-S-isoprenylcysteine O-methyltransferase Ste14